MRIFYVTNARIPTEKAHGIATVKLCEAFAKKGVDVTLLVPYRVNPLRNDPYEYYGAERNFKIKILPSVDFLWLGFGERFFFFLQVFSFSAIAALWVWLQYSFRDAVVFSHDHIPLFFASFFVPRIFYDIHDYPQKNPVYRRVLKRAVGLSVQTKRKIDALHKDFGVPQKKIIYWPNGTDVKLFDITISQAEAREKLLLPHDEKIILYTGQLFPGRGVDTLIEAAKLLPQGIVTYIVGGKKKDIENLQPTTDNLQPHNIVFFGQRPWKEIPLWLKAADVLVLPHSAKAHAIGTADVSLYYISPMKLFEYMASGQPIVASDIPSIREVVDETMVFFARPDDSRSFAETIREILANPGEAKRRSDNALTESRRYTWQTRAEKILTQLTRR